MSQAPPYGFWTEHEVTIDAPPISAELSALEPGRILTGSSPWSVHVLRGVYADYENAKTAQNEMHTIGWDRWLVLWKRQFKRKEQT